MNKLNVVMIGPFPTDENRIEGGVQASLYGLARGLRVHPDVASLRIIAVPKHVGGTTSEDTVAGIPVTRLTAPWRFMVSMVVNLPLILAMLAAVDDPVVHLHGSGLFEALILGACRLKRVPVVWTMHGITEKETLEAFRRQPGIGAWLRHLLYRACERLQLRMAPILVVDTPYVAREISDRVHATPQAVPQGIFLDELAPGRATGRTGRIILALGVIHPRKGHRLTIEAFAEVAKRVPDARLHIVGALTSVAHLTELHEAIHAHGLSSKTEIQVDLPRATVLEELAAARVYALHSQEESQGIAICEALAVGLPVVATRVGGIPDVLADSGAGLLVDYGDVPGFAAALTRMLEDDAFATACGEAAIRRGAEFDWSAITDRLVGIYRTARTA